MPFIKDESGNIENTDGKLKFKLYTSPLHLPFVGVSSWNIYNDGIIMFEYSDDHTNLVISLWFEIMQLGTAPRILDRTGTSGNPVYGWTFYYDDVSEYFIFNVANSAAAHGIHVSSDNLLEKWFFAVLTFDNNVYNLYLYNEEGLIGIDNFSVSMPDLTGKPLIIGNVYDQSRCLNGFVSNLYIGKYRNDQNEIIWTDTFIDQVYKVRRPFTMPSRQRIIG